jgi:hypothetical protein
VIVAVLGLAAAVLGAAVILPAIDASSSGTAVANKKGKSGKKRISGRLSAPGYMVIALAYTGKGVTAEPKGRSFSLRPPAERVTLHLRTRDGTYGGPIVLGTPVKKGAKKSAKKKGRKKGKSHVIVGVKAGAKLGKIAVNNAQGYAKVKGRPEKGSVDPKRFAQATKGVPIGNGLNVGLVRSTAHGPSSDLDLDGVSNPLDVDDDGDLILDQYDSLAAITSSQGRHSASTSATPAPGSLSTLTSLLFAGRDGVNVNAGSTEQQIAAAEQTYGQLELSAVGFAPGTAELDCGGSPDPDNQSGWIGGLSYCTRGGTGRLQTSIDAISRVGAPRFPECCDSDNDGLGTITNTGTTAGPPIMRLFHGASFDQIRPDDVLIARGIVQGATVAGVTSVGFLYATHPVVASYDDGQGNSGTISWPNSGTPPPVRAGPGGDLTLELRFWRPQRPHIPGDPGEGKWMDLGNLFYAVAVGSPGPGGPMGNFTCPSSSYSAVDPSLTPAPTIPIFPVNGGALFADRSGDRPSITSNSFGLTLNLSNCAAANGFSLSPTRATDVEIIAVLQGQAGAGFTATDSVAAFSLQP